VSATAVGTNLVLEGTVAGLAAAWLRNSDGCIEIPGVSESRTEALRLSHRADASATHQPASERSGLPVQKVREDASPEYSLTQPILRKIQDRRQFQTRTLLSERRRVTATPSKSWCAGMGARYIARRDIYVTDILRMGKTPIKMPC
jgi:hypothetical protein